MPEASNLLVISIHEFGYSKDDIIKGCAMSIYERQD